MKSIACAAFGLAALVATAAEDDIAAKLAQMSRPWTNTIHRITLAEYEATLKFWAEKHPKILTGEKRGASSEGLPIYLLKITDKSVPDAAKQMALITSLHSGPERSGGSMVMRLVEWLLSDAREAAETRRKQLLLVMPVNNPYAFFVDDQWGKKIDPYTGLRGKLWDLKTMTFTGAAQSPETAALVSVVDEFRPEVHLDCHGTGLQEIPPALQSSRLQYAGSTMFEITGSAYSNFALRPWDWRIIEAMVAAGREAGYPSERFEADAQRLFWGPELNDLADRLWLGRPAFYTAMYGYAKYHTLPAAIEVGWEESGVARARGLLRIGNGVWDGETTAGYPVNRARALMGHFVEASGMSAQERRDSRVELWQRQAEFSLASLYPQTDGRESFIVALTPEAGKLLTELKAKFLDNIKSLPGVRADAVATFFNAGPELKLIVDAAKSSAAHPPFAHAVALRLRLPYRKPKLVDFRLNGHLLRESATDGYQRCFGDGYTQLEINVPAAKANASGLLIVTCAYSPDVQRKNGWEPPREVAKQLKKGKP